MTEIYRHFMHSIRWNAFESITYQALLLAHQVALFSVTDYATYGLIGTLFSITYLLVIITNFGFDVSLSPFFTLLTKNKTYYKDILLLQLLPEYCILGILFACALLCKYLFFSSLLFFQSIDITMLFVLASLILFEGAKKTLRVLLQLACLSHKSAFIEVITIITYTSIVWIGYALGYPITLELVFIPLLLVSAASTVVLFFFVYDYYQELPENSESQLPPGTQWRIMRSRVFNFLNQISHSFFSSNFLVPFFAILFGFNKAGILKLISSIIHCITLIIQKVFGVSGALFFSRLKNMNLASKQNAFLIISNSLNHVLCGILIFIGINYSTLIAISSLPDATLTIPIGCLFLIITLSESFFIAYEKFYINEERADYLFLFNLIVIGFLILLISNAQHFSQLTLMIAFIAIRLIAFISLSILSFQQWQIKPTFKIQPVYLISFLLLSTLFRIFAHMMLL